MTQASPPHSHGLSAAPTPDGRLLGKKATFALCNQLRQVCVLLLCTDGVHDTDSNCHLLRVFCLLILALLPEGVLREPQLDG